MDWKKGKFGLQKMTLLDYPGRVACTIFTTGCNFRCPFCHNGSLVKGTADLLDGEEIFEFLRKRAGILEGICLTGGEPLLHKGVLSLMEEARKLGYRVKLDTNGYLPELLEGVLKEGLADYVAMDIKNSPEKYAVTANVPDLDIGKIEESIALLKSSSLPFEFRTTVVAPFHTPEDFDAIGKWLGDVPKYFLQKFVESGDLLGEGSAPVPEEEMRECLLRIRKYIPCAELRGM